MGTDRCVDRRVYIHSNTRMDRGVCIASNIGMDRGEYHHRQ
jgi:hypothetical protein